MNLQLPSASVLESTLSQTPHQHFNGTAVTTDFWIIDKTNVLPFINLSNAKKKEKVRGNLSETLKEIVYYMCVWTNTKTNKERSDIFLLLKFFIQVSFLFFFIFYNFYSKARLCIHIINSEHVLFKSIFWIKQDHDDDEEEEQE